MDRAQIACLFSSAPIAGCGGTPNAGSPVFASHWPLALIGGWLFGWAVWILISTGYRRKINWAREPGPVWETGDDDRPTIEIRARRAGE